MLKAEVSFCFQAQAENMVSGIAGRSFLYREVSTEKIDVDKKSWLVGVCFVHQQSKTRKFFVATINKKEGLLLTS